ncbi:DNA polymerase alpha catalytic subunit [Linum perenne]
MEGEEQQPVVAGRRRSRGGGDTARAEALERLKAIRRDGRRSERGYSIKAENPIYDTMPEEEYAELVARRKEEAQGFIVDDEGIGYGDEGEEEDWSKAGLPTSSDESDGGGERNSRRKRKMAERKEKEPQQKKVHPSSLTAAAAMMGKQKLSTYFNSTAMFRSRDSDKAKSLDCDSIVDDVIAEFAPDEADREKRRRGHPVVSNALQIKSESYVANVENKVTVNAVDCADNSLEHNGCGDEKETLVKEEEEKGVEAPSQVEDKGSLVVDESENVLQMKVEPVVKQELRQTLNAKISTEVKDPKLSATAGWEEVKRSGGNGVVAEESKSVSHSNEQPEFEVDANGSLPFYILDAHEEVFGANRGTLYLFGKVKAGNAYHSCCVIVKNMQRCVYAIPNNSVFQTDEMLQLEKDVEESRISPAEFRKKLQDVAHGLKDEVANQLVKLKVSSFSMTPVKRKYAFERSDVPLGENYALKINYSFKDSPLPTDLRGETFTTLLGTNTSALELFLVKRQIKGPSWLMIPKFSICQTSQKVSWCKFEISVDVSKDIQNASSSKIAAEIPPVVVTAINLKTILNEKQNVNEIVSASLVCCHKAKIDSPMLAPEREKPGMVSHFTVVRKLDGGIFPMGFSKELADRNMKAGSRSTVLSMEPSERALLNRLMTELHKLDSDILVGHNISGFDLDVLLHRAQACRVPSSMWSRIGRLKRSMMPKLSKPNGSRASQGILSCLSGRLLCDTYLSSRDLLKEVSYSLTQLAKNRLGKDRKEVAPHDIPKMFQTSESLIELIQLGETDAWLSMELMFHLNVLPLTRQLTNISGNLWGQTFQGARALRVEYLLLHAFRSKKYIVPDKQYSSHAKEANSTKRKIHQNTDNAVTEEAEIEDIDFENERTDNSHRKGKKGPAYAGGLVLEPKKGLYDKYVLLLDFNSLYPSIIQEYNICFTTVERSSEGVSSRLPSSTTTGVLPELLKNLVERRRMVKSWMKSKTGLKLQQLDIQQQALKLTANSMYGCLGFSNSRFYAKPLAELITLQGREILQSTVDLVQHNLNFEVIYGDTDSIMIYSGLDDIAKAKAIAGKVIQEVNKKYRCLEIDLDGLYKRMLLLKKKKYAAIKIQFKDGTPYEVRECKGIDMVRRDWSLLSKEVGGFCLDQILSGSSCEDVVESIHNYLMKVRDEMRSEQVELKQYVITKSLTKPPEAYPDAKNQPHVMVALRLKQSGYTTGCSAHDTVPYVICTEQGSSSAGSAGIAQRARHPDELEKDNGKWMVDIDYYLSQQIHPVVSRLCAPIQGTSPERLADCLGLDSSRFRSRLNEAADNNPSISLVFAGNDEERYQNCEPLTLSCPSCSNTFDCPAIFPSIYKSSDGTATEAQPEESTSNFWRTMRCPKCPEDGNLGRISPAMIANQVTRQADNFVSTYYKDIMMCDDETCKHTTRSINLKLVGELDKGTVCPNHPRCNGKLLRKYSEGELYRQLSYFCFLLDTKRCLEKHEMEASKRFAMEEELKKIRGAVEMAATTVEKLRDRCAYGWVQLDNFTVTV